jgi:hypothetical protein
LLVRVRGKTHYRERNVHVQDLMGNSGLIGGSKSRIANSPLPMDQGFAAKSRPQEVTFGGRSTGNLRQ